MASVCIHLLDETVGELLESEVNCGGRVVGRELDEHAEGETHIRVCEQRVTRTLGRRCRRRPARTTTLATLQVAVDDGANGAHDVVALRQLLAAHQRQLVLVALAAILIYNC